MFKLLADMMVFVLRAPFRLMDAINQFMLQRQMTERLSKAGKGELQKVSKFGKFIGFIGVLIVWILLIALFVGCLVLLWYLNGLLNLERILGGPWPALRPYWLPLLMVLFCISCFVGYRLYRSLGPDRDAVDFADLEDAWNEAKAALVEAGVDVTSVPLFLVLGRPASSLHSLMTASRLTFAVQQVPLRAEAPLQVYANRHAIYVVLPDACLLGRQAELLFAAEEVEEPVSKPASNSVFEEPEPVLDPVLDEGTQAEPKPLPPVQIDPILATRNLLAEPDSGGVGLMTAPAQAETMPWMLEGHRRMPALLKRTDEVDNYKRRLAFAARRIGQARAPYCPLNGVLVLLPFEALENDEDSSQLAALVQADLQVLHDTARMRCPVLLLVTDLERGPGYAALSECLDLDRRTRLFGQELPLLPDLKPEELPRLVAGSLRHFGEALAHWFARLFRVERSLREPSADSIRSNSQLFALMGAIRQREQALERIVMRLLTADPSLEFMVGGYYLAATGANPDRDQAFVPGVFQQLVQSQNAVSWTEEALSEEADYQRWTTYGYAALAIFCIVVIVIIYGRWQMLRW